MRNVGSSLLLGFILLSSTIMMVAPPMDASAQTLANSITQGQNYDLREDYINGIATWTSYQERILEGDSWVDFIVSNYSDFISVESNSIGSLVYDKDTCSYSIYENGIISPSKEIIPSVSWYPRIAQVGGDNYSGIDDLHNAQCNVSVDEKDDYVIITSIKTLKQDIDPVIINHSNGTQSVYPQGLGIVVAKQTQTLEFSLDRGIKETVSLYNGNPEWDNHKFALTQTAHTGPSINLAGVDYDIAGNSGTVLDRNWIEDNESQIFEIADSLSYDFDVGFEQFNALRIIDDFGTYKVALDFSVNDITPVGSSYTVDPTFSASADVIKRTYDNGSSGTSCADPGTSTDSTKKIQRATSGGVGTCQKMSFQWDVSSLPSAIAVTDSDIAIEIATVSSMGSETCAFYPMTEDLGSASIADIHTDATDGTAYVNNIACSTTGVKNVDLGTQADSDITTQANGDNEFEVGFFFSNLVRDGSTREATTQTPTLSLTYDLVTAPGAPTSMATTDGIPIGLSWTAPSNTGGTALTDYKIFRSTYQHPEQPLPDNEGADTVPSGHASNVDMQNNIVLYHLDDYNTSTNKIEDTSSNNIDIDLPVSTSDIEEGGTADNNAASSYLTYKQIPNLTSGSEITHTMFDGYSASSISFKTALYDDNNNQPGNIIQNSSNQDCKGEITGQTYSTYTTIVIPLDVSGCLVPADGKVWVSNYPSGTVNHRVQSGNGAYQNSVYCVTNTAPGCFPAQYSSYPGQSAAQIGGNGGNDVRYGVRVATTTIPTFSDAAIDLGINDPKLTVSSASIPLSGTNSWTVGAWTMMGTTPATLYEEDFSNFNSFSNTGAYTISTVSNNAWYAEIRNLNTPAQTTIPLGMTISGEKFVMEYSIKANTISNYVFFQLGLGDVADAGWQTSESFVGNFITLQGNSGNGDLRSGYREGVLFTDWNGGSAPGVGNYYPAGDTQYIRLIKDGTSLTTSIYDTEADRDSSTNALATSSQTNAPANMSGLQYLQLIITDYNNTTNYATIDDISICSGDTTMSNCSASPSSNPTTILSFDNSAGEQGKIEVEPTKLRFNLGAPNTITYSTDFSSNTGWTEEDSGKMTISNGVIDFRATGVDQTGDNIWYDLGTPASNTAWILRWDVTYDGAGGGNNSGENHLIALTSGNGSIDMANPWSGSGSEDRIGYGYSSYQSTKDIGIVISNDAYSNAIYAGSDGVSGTNLDVTGTVTYYMELKRTSDTDVSLDIKTGSHTGTSRTGFPVTSTSASSSVEDLQYIKILNRAVEGVRDGWIDGKLDNLQFCDGQTSWAGNCSTASTSIDIEKTGLTIPGDSLSHIALTKNSNDYTFYINGTSVHTATDTDSLGTISNNKIWIGTQTDGLTNPASQLDEFFINSVAESSTTIDNIFDRGANKFTNIHTMGNTNTSYNDSSVSAGTDYTYATKAYNGNFYSGYSNFAYGSTVQQANAPTNLIATNGITQANLSWTASTDLGGGSFLGYYIERSLDQTTWTLVAQPSSAATTYADTTANTLGTTYYYRVSTVNEVGPGLTSTSANVLIADVPGAPSISSITPASNANLAIVWTAPGSDGGATIASYVIDRSDDNGQTWTNSIATINGLTHTDTGLTVGTTYTYRVAATNSVGTGNESVTASGLAGDVPDAITSVTATAQPNYEIDIAWTAPNDNSYSITSYDLYQDDGTNPPVKVFTGNALTYTSTGLTAGTSYTYNVVTSNQLGTSADSTQQPSATAGDIPTAPTNLAITVQAGGILDLSWTAPTSPGYPSFTYEIQVSTDGGNTWNVEQATYSNASTAYTDTGLTNGVTYDYRLRATNVLGTGGWSNVAGDKAGDIPDSPPNLQASTVSASEITVSWSVPSDNGYPITQYNLERSLDQTTWTVIANQLPTSFSDTGLTQSTTYYYRVSAANALGTSPYAPNVSGQTYGVPAPVNTLALSVQSTTQIDLGWTPPAMNGYPFVSYTVERSTDGGITWTILVTQTAVSYSHTGLTPNTDHLYRVFATNSFGSGNPGTQQLIPTLPTPPVAVTVTTISDTQLDLSWNTPAGSPPATTGFKIERSLDDVTWSDLVADTGNTNTVYSDTSLSPITTYYYRISTINVSGTSVASSVGEGKTFGVPESPTTLTATPLPGALIQLDWVAPTVTNGANISGYQIERSLDNVTWSVLVADTGNTNVQYTDSGLNTPQTYYYRVGAINSYGVGAPSNVSSAIASDVPDQVTNLTGIALPSAEIKIDWVTPANNGYQITGYIIERSIDAGQTWGVLVADTQSTAVTYTDTALTIGNTYNYRVAAINAVGTGLFSADVAVVAGDIPSQPVIVVTALPTSQIEITWTAPNDNGYALSGFAIERSTDGTTWSPLTTAGATATSYTDSGLTNGQDYYYRLTAINAIGNSSWSVTQSATSGDVPGQVTGLTVTTISDVSLQLQWTTPADNSYSIIGYKIETSLDNTTWTTITANTQSTTTTFTDASLNQSTDYWYRVSAINGLGTGLISTSVMGHTFGPPDPVTSFGSTSTDTSITLNWTAPNDNGSPIISYRIEVLSFSTSQYITLDTVGGGITTYTQSPVYSNTAYTYRIVGTNLYGSDTSASFTVYSKPDAPGGLTGNAVSSTEIDVSWNAVADQNNHGLTQYTISRSPDQTTWTTLSSGITTLSYSDTGLTQGTAYYYRVLASNPQGSGDWSTTLTSSTLSPPSEPLNFTITAPYLGDPTDVRLDWDAPTINGGDPNFTYEVQISLDNITWNPEQQGISNSQEYYIDEGLAYGTQFYWRVLAISGAGQGTTTPSVTYTVPNVPTPPANLVVTPTGSNNSAGLLDWDPPANSYGYQIIGYQIERNINTSGWDIIVQTTGSTATVMTNTGLTAGNVYEYRVAAITSVGVGGVSNTDTLDLLSATAHICTQVSPACPTISSAPFGNTVELNPFVEVTSGTPLPSMVQIKTYQNNAVVDTTEMSTQLQSGSNIINMINAYPNQQSDFYVIVTLDTGYTIQSNTISLTPVAPFDGAFTLVEDRDTTYQSSTVDMTVQPSGADVILEYRSQDSSDPIITKGYQGVTAPITESTPVDEDKDYYVTMYVNPTFQFTVDPTTLAVTVVCTPGDPLCSGNIDGTGVTEDIPKGTPPIGTVKSFRSPDAQQQLGIEPIGDLFGVPMIFIFVVGLAGLFTGRSAPMGVIFIVTTIGVMAYLGYIDFAYPDATWVLLVLSAVLGVFLGKRYS